ncbi:MAG TPA: TolC family protein [Bacteroidales bacterium]|nr:TolC family protein [Bacteroidales bacterium]
MYFKKLLIAVVFFLPPGISYSQENFKDTISVSLSGADSLFIKGNLSLLAEKCNVGSARAQVIQARLFRNPNFSITQNIFNPYYKSMNTRQWFDFSDRGEMEIQVQKLFLLAGKRDKKILLAETGAMKEEQLYFDLLRTLRYTLHSRFFNIYYLERTLSMYDREIASLNRLSAAYGSEEGKGLISKKEVLRIKASLFSLENEKLGYTTEMISAQTDFNILMHTSGIFYEPVIKNELVTNFQPDSVKLSLLVDTAYQCRYDLKVARTDLAYSNLNLAYQKALSVPDMTVSGGWDRNGGYFHNYNYVGLQFDLPLFDRNQGNIKSAKFDIENSKYKVLSAEDQVKADVISAYAGAVETDRLYEKFDSKFLEDLETMNKEMLRNYEKKNISLIEFLDYYEAYKTNVVQCNTLMFNRINSIENLNFAVGKEIFTN